MTTNDQYAHQCAHDPCPAPFGHWLATMPDDEFAAYLDGLDYLAATTPDRTDAGEQP